MKRKNVTINKEEIKPYQDAKICYTFGKRILNKFANNKNYRKVKDNCHFIGKYRGAAHSICHLKFNVPNEIPVVFHNSLNFDYHFIIKKIANKFEGQFECLGENTKNKFFFSFSIEK